MTDETKGQRTGNGSLPPGAAAFVEAVALQLSRAVDYGDAGETLTRATHLTRRLFALLDAVSRGMDDAAVGILTEEPLLLSSVFQNVDLLYEHGFPFADGLGMVTLTAIHAAPDDPESTEVGSS